MFDLGEMRMVFESHLSETDFGSQPKDLYDPIYYTLNLGGKRIRPLLLLLTNDIYGGDIKEAMPAAMAIEMFHNFTLVHDDIMDHDELRRGRDTVYKKYDESIAILAGDGLLVQAYAALARVDGLALPRVISAFSLH